MKFVVSPHCFPLSDNGLKGICKQNKVSSSSHSVSLSQSSSHCQSAIKPACHPHSIIALAARTPFSLCSLPSRALSSRGSSGPLNISYSSFNQVTLYTIHDISIAAREQIPKCRGTIANLQQQHSLIASQKTCNDSSHISLPLKLLPASKSLLSRASPVSPHQASLQGVPPCKYISLSR